MDLKAKAIAELENLPEENIAEVIDFIAEIQKKNIRRSKTQEELRESHEAFENLKKYFRRIPADFNFKKEYFNWVDEKYGSID